MKALLITALVLGSSSFAFANHECKEIKAACEAAGFTKGGHKSKKGLAKDCIKPIMAGQTVEGVSVTPEQVSACKDKKSAHQAKKAAKAGEATATSPAK